jgi:propionate CoA-transferase
VFRRGKKGLELIEIAPGIDLDRDVLAHMDFRPEFAEDIRIMDERLFLDKPMGLINDITAKPPINIPKRLRE